MNAPKYRKKPIIIDATVWEHPGDHPEVGYYRHPPVDPATGDVSAADNAILMGQLRHSEVPERFRRADCHTTMHYHGFIDTLEGGHTVCPGDFIITGVKGEFYPCKPDIFAATYEEVEQ
ncbi:MAG: hypothetical protein ACK4UY_03950 [Dietzia sp.]